MTLPVAGAALASCCAAGFGFAAAAAAVSCGAALWGSLGFSVAFGFDAAAGIRYPGRTDVLLVLFDAGTAVSGVFTRSKCPSAAVDWCRDQIKRGGGGASALVVNSGNANAFTGKSGRCLLYTSRCV